MNIYFEKLLENSQLNEKNRFELRQIFYSVSNDKKKRIIEKFDELINDIIKIEQDLKVEQEIILGQALDKAEKVILKSRGKNVKKKASKEIFKLKEEL